MDLGFFTMPIHPPARSMTETLKEDREFALFADELGFTEGLFGEHITDAAETRPPTSVSVITANRVPALAA